VNGVFADLRFLISWILNDPRNRSWARKRCAPKVGAMRRGIDVHGEYEKLEVTYMEVGYADNAGAITCHLIGDERFFRFTSDAAFRCVKSSP
jgi:hypothetical protein